MLQASPASTRGWDSFPVAPRKFPFFYGWIILPCAIIGLLVSVPGQTIGVSVFTDSLLEVLQLGRVELSTAYMVGTVISAFLLPRAGRVYDRFGARLLTPVSAIGLGLTLIFLSVVDHSINFLSRAVPIPRQVIVMVLMILSFTALRFFGQGMMTMLPRNMAMKWFVRRRGMINGILGVSIAVGFSGLTYLLNIFVQEVGWSSAWQQLGLGIALGVSLLAALFYRDSPEVSGLLPDGGGETKKSYSGNGVLADGANLAEAMKYFEFWMYVLAPALVSLSITAVSFHIVSIFELAGHSRAEAIGIYLPAAVISSIGVLIGGWATDRLPLSYVLRVMCLAQALLPLGLLLLQYSPGYWLVVVAMGLSQASFGLLLGISWPRLFGLRHLGEIGGYAMAVTVFGSAVGPLLFGLSLQWTGGYAALEVVCLLVACIFTIGAFRVRV